LVIAREAEYSAKQTWLSSRRMAGLGVVGVLGLGMGELWAQIKLCAIEL
jgi:hypothetical protein